MFQVRSCFGLIIALGPPLSRFLSAGFFFRATNDRRKPGTSSRLRAVLRRLRPGAPHALLIFASCLALKVKVAAATRRISCICRSLLLFSKASKLFFFFPKGFLTFQSSRTVPGTRRSRHAVLTKILPFEPSFLRPSAVIILGSDWPTLIQINIQI